MKGERGGEEGEREILVKEVGDREKDGRSVVEDGCGRLKLRSYTEVQKFQCLFSFRTSDHWVLH